MIIYITSGKNSGIFDEIAKERRLIVNKITKVWDLRRLISQQTANFSHCSYFAVDIEALNNTEEEITNALFAFTAMYPKSKVIAVCLGAENGDNLLTELYNIGVFALTDEKEITNALNAKTGG
jgi:hypothetical protein